MATLRRGHVRQASDRLVLRPLATDNRKGTGNLEIRFGKFSATVSFTAHEEEKDEKK